MAHANLKSFYHIDDPDCSPEISDEDYMTEQERFRMYLEDQEENRQIQNEEF
jgi:hypothetical protein